jgi:hypothetical protein
MQPCLSVYAYPQRHGPGPCKDLKTERQKRKNMERRPIVYLFAIGLLASCGMGGKGN